MANSITSVRSNHFQVTDPERLKCLTDAGNLELWEEDGFYVFGAESSESCSVDTIHIGADELDLTEELQAILKDGETCIIIENSHEKIRYVTSFAIIITKDDIEVKSIAEIALKAAKEKNPDLSKQNESIAY